MAVMFERLSEHPDYVLLAAKQDDMLVGKNFRDILIISSFF
jgi:hypothetical protein